MSPYLEFVEEQLFKWGEWSRLNTVRLGVKPTCLVNASKTPRDRLYGDIPDAEAEAIDRCVAQLQECEPDLHKVAKLFFISALTVRDVARAVKRSRTVVHQQRQTVIAFIAGSLPEKFNLDRTV